MHNIFHTIRKKVHPLKTRARLIKNSWKWQTADIIFIGTMLFAALALFALLWYNVRPIKTVDIKVPVATDRSAYAPGEQISGIFFGEIFYEGSVRVLRQVYCKDYVKVIEPPAEAKNGDFYDTQSVPRKLEGLSVAIGNLPADIPIGKNCVLQFTNVYDIATPFGTRHIEYKYYTQNFAIISQERRNLLECEATGRKDCDPPDVIIQEVPVSYEAPSTPESPQTPRQTAQNSPQSTEAPNTDTNPSARQSQPETPQNEPVTPPRNCRVDFLFLHLFC